MQARFKPDQLNSLCPDLQDNNAMHAKPDLRVFLEWMIAGSGSLIGAVILLESLGMMCCRNCADDMLGNSCG